MQGWRSGHEDAHEVRCNDKAGAFWVLDGHGGDGVALYGAPKLGEEFADSMAQAIMPSNPRIEEGLIGVDKVLRAYCHDNPEKDSGSTVVGALVTKESNGTYNLKLVNCGDSRGIIVRGTGERERTAQRCTLKVPQHLVDLKDDAASVRCGDAALDCTWPLIQESIDHKPSHPTEKARIKGAGGYVSGDDPPRLDGNLAVSRGLGDFEFKSNNARSAPEQKVSCVPDVYEINGLQPGSLCILCCDGVWDVMNGQEVGTYVRDKLQDDPEADLGELAYQIIRMSFDKGSGDNITAMIVQLSPDKSAEKHVHIPDEMKGFDKMISEEPTPDADMLKQYKSFLKKSAFPPEPVRCEVCSKWYLSMMKCPCGKVNYCSKSCQKKGWKEHKQYCTFIKPGQK